MAEKTVVVELSSERGFRTECRAGSHTLFIDQPKSAGGTDAGPTPLDYQLLALGGCISAISRIVAAQKRLPIRSVKVKVEGTINTDALLGKTTDCRVGFSSITATVSLDGEMSAKEKEEFLAEVERRCPISDNLQHQTPVKVVCAG